MSFQEIKITRFPTLTIRSVANYSVPDKAILRNFHTLKGTQMNTQQVNFSSLYFGTPVAIISSQNADGTTNLSPISS